MDHLPEIVQIDGTPSRRNSEVNAIQPPSEAVAQSNTMSLQGTDGELEKPAASPKSNVVKRVFTGKRHVSIECDDSEASARSGNSHTPKSSPLRRKSVSASFSPGGLSKTPPRRRRLSTESVDSHHTNKSSRTQSRRVSTETEGSDDDDDSKSKYHTPSSSRRKSLYSCASTPRRCGKNDLSSSPRSNPVSRKALRGNVAGHSLKTAMNAIKAIRIWKKESSCDGDPNKRYRTTVARRMVYAKAKQYLEDTKSERRIGHIFKAVSVGARQVLMMGKVCDIYMCVIDEMRIRRKMANLANTLFAMADWKSFLSDLKLVRTDIQAAVDRHRDMIQDAQEQARIAVMSKLIESHFRAEARLNQRSEKLSHAYDQMVSQKGKKKEAKAEKVWEAIMSAKRDIKNIEQCTQDLHCAVSMLGRMEAREGLGHHIDVESEETIRKDNEMLASLPEREMATMIDGFVQSDSGDDLEATEISRVHLESLSFDKGALEECINAMRRIAWRKLVFGSIQAIQSEYENALGILKSNIERIESSILLQAHGPPPAKLLEKDTQLIRKEDYGDLRKIYRKPQIKVYTTEEIENMMFQHEHASEFGSKWLEEVSNKIHAINAEECDSEEGEKRRRSSLLYIHSDALRASMYPKDPKESAPSVSSDAESGLDLESDESSQHGNDEQCEDLVDVSFEAPPEAVATLVESPPPEFDRSLLWSPHPRNRVGKIIPALNDLKVALCSRWGSAEQAISSLMANSADHLDGKVVSVQQVCSEIASYIPHSMKDSIVSLLFKYLGACIDENGCVSIEDFRKAMTTDIREPDPERVKYYEKMWRALLVRDALLSSIHGPETLLARVQLASLGATVVTSANIGTKPADALTDALHACFQSLHAQECREVAAAILSPSGLHIILNVLSAVSVSMELRIISAILIADAIECHAGPSYKSRFSSSGFQGDAAIPPIGFDTFLVAKVWRPVFEIFDPEAAIDPPPALEQDLIDALFALLRQLRFPSEDSCLNREPLVMDVCRGLRQLHSCPLVANALLHSLRSFRTLEEQHEQQDGGLASEVHMVIAAFGGCRFLREQIARMQGVEGHGASRFSMQGDKMLRSWRAARQRLFAKVPATSQHKAQGRNRLDMLAKILQATVSEGFKAVNFTEEYRYTNVANVEDSHETENGTDVLFAPDSMELNLWQRLVNRWEASNVGGVSFYDWDRLDTVPLAEALCESRNYLARGNVPPVLRMPPKLVKPRNRSPKLAKPSKHSILPSLSPLTPHPLLFDTSINSSLPSMSSLAAESTMSWSCQTHQSFDHIEVPATRAQTAGANSRYRQMQWVIGDTSQQSARPSTQNSSLRPLRASPRLGANLRLQA